MVGRNLLSNNNTPCISRVSLLCVACGKLILVNMLTSLICKMEKCNITGANVITAQNVTIYDNVNLAPNVAILSNTNPVPTTPPNTLAQYKYPITINGNVYYINLSSAI